MMVIKTDESRVILSRGVEFSANIKDFEVITHDGMYKVAMGLIEQPGHGVAVRRQKGGPPKGEIHVVQTLRTKSGCTCGVMGAFSEGSAFVWSFVKTSLAGGRALTQVRLFLTDSPGTMDTASMFALLPELVCVAADPPRRALEVETLFGKSRSGVSAALRKLRRKFAPKSQWSLDGTGFCFPGRRTGRGQPCCARQEETSLWGISQLPKKRRLY